MELISALVVFAPMLVAVVPRRYVGEIVLGFARPAQALVWAGLVLMFGGSLKQARKVVIDFMRPTTVHRRD